MERGFDKLATTTGMLLVVGFAVLTLAVIIAGGIWWKVASAAERDRRPPSD